MANITLAHGSGGRLMHELIRKKILGVYGNPVLNRMADAAVLELDKKRIAFTTDSFVVKPLIFKGGDIGKLAVCGTVNDLAVSGALPLYISCSLIIEEGLSEGLLMRFIASMKKEARTAGVEVVTGDIKVVEKGNCDGIFINTSGIGVVKYSRELSVRRIKPGDKVIINGTIADHGTAVMLARNDLGFKSGPKSDCASLNGLILMVLNKCSNVKFMRDPTRGGVAAVMNEIVEDAPFGIQLFEDKIPISKETASVCEILGIEPLQMANEGKVIAIVGPQDAGKALRIMKKHSLGRRGAIIGEVTKDFKGRVVLKTKVGGERIVDMPVLEVLPRIC
ncbi:MAG: hydrogenase expression/formation protein HypE [Candidatus Omnitrophica bacterium]|nr:hydrogenase expression/formation protein HypE [Candidatus Omnitrophota bacterium]MBU4487492.1 hydrogenase expression/formation protein HypE [Candidatus Omnitrophota bacterium]MCG2704918.1 hydrogenase expression/formation protein HypE [Candidatus Omnitrophota bacterium]